MVRANAARSARPGIVLPVLLLLAVLLGRGLLPSGYMVAPAASGWPSLILCPGAVTDQAASSGDHDHRSKHRLPGKRNGGSEVPCAFATLLPPLLPSDPPVLGRTAPPPQFAGAWVPVSSVWRLTLAAPPPPVRGPPERLAA
jgi:hypothetical protein